MVVLFIIGGLMWGSFLNLVGHRLLSGQSLLGARSRCPQCDVVIAWYDLIPVVSYVVLRGRCRQCAQPISWLYPFIEVCGAVAGVAVWFDAYMIGAATEVELVGRAVAYGLLLSGFIVATRTDFEALVVPRVVILFLAVVGMVASVVEVLPVTMFASLLGALVGYGSLWALNKASLWFSGRQGIGEGDMELLGVVGIFWGPIGVWAVTMVSSLAGIVLACVYLAITGQGRHTRIPFIPFMAAAVCAYLFFQQHIMAFLF